MKKLLLASTALVMTAGAAAAQVSMSGSARMGIAYDNQTVFDGATNNARLKFTSRIRVQFTMSGETDTGLAFGATVRGDQFGDANAGNDRMAGGSVFIAGEFGRLTFGDVAGAARSAVGDLYGVGLTGVGDLNEIGYLDRTFSGPADTFTGLNRRTSVLYQYSIDGFSFYASLGQNRRIDAIDPGTLDELRVTEQLAALGVAYSFDGFTLSAGYELAKGKFKNVTENESESVDAKHLVIGAEYAIDNFKVKAIAGRVSGDLGTALGEPNNGARRTQYGLSVSGEFDATTVTAFAHRSFTGTNYGIGASYDLGGGASLVGGISRLGSNSTLDVPDLGLGPVQSRTRADFGLNFTF
ncbi:porin [Roseinatronobacter sp.]